MKSREKFEKSEEVKIRTKDDSMLNKNKYNNKCKKFKSRK
jgi:hypothetical protein